MTIIDENPIRALHRGQDGYVGFCRYNRKAEKPWENLAGLKVSTMAESMPQLVEHLGEDSYFTVNSMWGSAPYDSKVTGLPAPRRGNNHLRYLNACYVDLDVGRPESPTLAGRMNWRDAMARAGKMMDDGIIPQASFFARSGRGLYIFWILQDVEDISAPQRAWAEARTLYTEINRRLGIILTDLAADQRAFDGARVLRVPGSIHSGVQEPVTYMPQLDRNGQYYSYTLDEMAMFIGISTALRGPSSKRDRIVYGRPVQNPGSAPNRKNGLKARGQKRAGDWELLAKYFGGWPKGRRRFRLCQYAQFLKESGADRKTITERVRRMAEQCQPPYPSDPSDSPVPALVNEALNNPIVYNVRNDTLLARLGIGSDIVRALNLSTIITEEVAAERQAARPKRADTIARRRELIAEAIRTNAEQTCRDMVKMLAAHGIKSNRETVNREMNAAGYTGRLTGHRSRRQLTK